MCWELSSFTRHGIALSRNRATGPWCYVMAGDGLKAGESKVSAQARAGVVSLGLRQSCRYSELGSAGDAQCCADQDVIIDR